MKIENLVNEFLLDCGIRSLSPRTIKSCRNNLTHFFEPVASVPIENVTTQVIKGRIAEFQQKGAQPTYINSIIKTLRSFYVYLLGQEYLTTNPMLKVPWCKERLVLIKAFTDNEVKRMMSVYHEQQFLELRNKTIMAMLLDTGIRCLELCTLTDSSIKDLHISIMGKGNKERIAAISPPLNRLLHKYMRMKERHFAGNGLKTDCLFVSRTGRQLTNAAVERIVRTAGEKAKISDSIRCSPHTCRHYFAQAQVRNGCDIYTLSKLLGHSNIKITQIYLNSMQDDDIIERALTTSPLINL